MSGSKKSKSKSKSNLNSNSNSKLKSISRWEPKSELKSESESESKSEKQVLSLSSYTRRAKKLFEIFAMLFLILIVMAFAITVAVISFNRHDLKPEDPEIWVDSAVLSQINVTESELTATWELTLVIVNPNKKLSIIYKDLQVTLFYIYKRYRMKIILAAKPVAPPSFLNPGNQSSLSFKLATVTAFLRDDVAEKMSEEMARGGSVKFGLKLLSWWAFDTHRFDVKGLHYQRLLCNQVEFPLSINNGSLTGDQPGLTACKSYGNREYYN